MLSKKQFLSVLLSGVIIFVILFRTLYTYSYNQGLQDPTENSIPNPIEEAVEVATQEEHNPLPTEPEVARIMPDTQVKIELLTEGEIYETHILESNIVMGMSKEDLENYLSAYDVVFFSEDEVILQKMIEAAPPMPSYVLGVKEGNVGVLEITGSQPFISLNMELIEFSSTASDMIESGDITISIEERQKLQLNPYYIEVILQNQYRE